MRLPFPYLPPCSLPLAPPRRLGSQLSPVALCELIHNLFSDFDEVRLAGERGVSAKRNARCGRDSSSCTSMAACDTKCSRTSVSPFPPLPRSRRTFSVYKIETIVSSATGDWLMTYVAALFFFFFL